jgi:RNA polymerase sigma factor (sigma-70 family)
MDNSKIIHTDEGKAGIQSITVCRLNDTFVETFLIQMDPYIIRAVTRGIRGNLLRIHPALVDLEINEVAQRIRIKFWGAWQKRHIKTPTAYLKRIIHNEIIEFARTYQPTIPLPLDKYGELYQGEMILAYNSQKSVSGSLEEALFSTYWAEQEQRLTEKNIRTIVKIMLFFPEQQRYALLYKLNLVKDDIFYLKTVLQDLDVDLQQIPWPQTPQEKKRMGASYLVAKRTLATILGQKKEDRMKNALEWLAQQERRRRQWNPIDTTAKEKPEPNREIVQMICHLENLKEPYQTILRLHYLEQRSYSDIATLLNLSVATVKSRVRRGYEGISLLAQGAATTYAKLTQEEQQTRTKILSEIKARVSELKNPYQTAVYLRYIEEKDYAEIARQQNVPLNTVKSRVHRGLKILNIQPPEK